MDFEILYAPTSLQISAKNEFCQQPFCTPQCNTQLACGVSFLNHPATSPTHPPSCTPLPEENNALRSTGHCSPPAAGGQQRYAEDQQILHKIKISLQKKVLIKFRTTLTQDLLLWEMFFVLKMSTWQLVTHTCRPD